MEYNVLVVIPSGPSRKEIRNNLESKIHEATGFDVFVANGDIGFSSAVNDGLSKALLNGYDYAWVLNDDVEVVFDGLVENFFKFFKAFPSAIMGHKIVSMEDKDTIVFGGAGDPYPSGYHKTGSLRAGDLNEITYEKWITFASVVIPTEVILQIGMLDERMKWVYSDSDYCYRARWAGFPCIYNPNILIYHKGGISARPDSEERIREFRRDAFMFAAKWINGYAYYSLNLEKFNAINKEGQKNSAQYDENIREEKRQTSILRNGEKRKA